jgi:quinol-cytochrome oxidoreductase complex cytochrome b subunit
MIKSLKKRLFRELLGLRTPKNIRYFWGFGRLLGVVIVVQVFSGIFLAFYYVRGSLG